MAFKLFPGNFLVCLKNRICFYFPFPQEQPVKTNFWYPNTSVPLQCSWSGQLGFCVSQQQTSPEDWAGLEVPDLPSLTQNGAVTLCNIYGFIQPELCWDRSCHSAKLNDKQNKNLPAQRVCKSSTGIWRSLSQSYIAGEKGLKHFKCLFSFYFSFNQNLEEQCKCSWKHWTME